MTGFDACRLIRQAIRSNTVDRAHLEEVEEALKQLGWGRAAKDRLAALGIHLHAHSCQIAARPVPEDCGTNVGSNGTNVASNGAR
jgi:hypothetical protein